MSLLLLQLITVTVVAASARLSAASCLLLFACCHLRIACHLQPHCLLPPRPRISCQVEVRLPRIRYQLSVAHDEIRPCLLPGDSSISHPGMASAGRTCSQHPLSRVTSTSTSFHSSTFIAPTSYSGSSPLPLRTDAIALSCAVFWAPSYALHESRPPHGMQLGDHVGEIPWR